MPLQTLNTPHYIKRTKVLTNYRHTLDDSGLPRFTVDYIYELPDLIQNVVGIELRNFAMSNFVSPTWIGRFRTSLPNLLPGDDVRSTTPGNHVMDMLVTDEFGVTSLSMVISMDDVFGVAISLTGFPFEKDGIITVVGLTILFIFLAAQPLPVLTPAAYNPEISITGDGRFKVTWQQKLAPFAYASVQALFLTGPNEADSMHRVLGFDKVDTVPDPIDSSLTAPYLVNPRPFRFVDVTIRELPQLRPHSRFFFDKIEFSSPVNQQPPCQRLLQNPIQRLTEITISLRLEGNRSFGHFHNPVHELEFEILSLEPSVNIPGWVDQELMY